MQVTDFTSLFQKSLALKKALKPQSLISYKENRESTKMTKQMLFERQNAEYLKEMEKIAKEKERISQERIKRLKYLYRKKTKGTVINLHTINKSMGDDPSEGQFKRIKQYEHYIGRKIGFITMRRELHK